MGSSQPASLQVAGGRLDVHWPGLATCSKVVARCRLADGTVHDSRRWAVVKRLGPRGGELRTRSGPVDVTLDVKLVRSTLQMRLRVVARRSCEVRDLGLAFQALVSDAEPQWVLYNGYQSWDPAGHARLRGASGEDLRKESWWTCGIADERGRGVALAAQRARVSALRFEARGPEVAALCCAPEGLTAKTLLWRAEKDAVWEGETLLATAGGDVRASLAELLGNPVLREVPRGWLSWYHYGTWVTRQDVLENAALVAEGSLRDGGYRVIQIDDGWQEAYGEWVPNSKFAPDLGTLTQRLVARGQLPGIWTAPFLVSSAARLAVEAPDSWFLSDPATGERAVDHRHSVFGPMFVLDGRRRAVCRHLEDVFCELHRAGFRYFKIDFLYAGAYAGIPALRAGVSAIRRAVQDSYLLGCGAPLLPLAGLVDGCRVGQDTATPLYNFELGAPSPTIFGSEIESVVRNVAARHLLSAWFQPDPDVALVGGNLSVRQARQLVTVAALSGGPFFASDNLGLIPAERLALLTNPEVLALVGGPPAVPDWEPGDLPPAVWRREGGIVAVFNWTDLEKRVEVALPGRWRAHDLWARTPFGEFNDCLRLDIEPLGVRLLRLSTR
jgi:hypothetical protein